MYYIQQLQKQDCGIACLKMLLARTFKRKEYLYLRQDLNHEAYSYQELIDIASNHGLQMNGYRYIDKKKILFDRPKNILVSIQIEGGGFHMVLLKRVLLNRFYVADPYMGNYSISKKKFLKIWDGTILKIDDIEKQKSIPEKPYKLSKWRKLFLILLRFFGLISGILGVFYIDNKVNPIIPIALMFVCFLFEIVYRVATLRMMKRLDNEVLKMVDKYDSNPSLFIDTYSNFKQMEVMLIPSLIFSCSMTCFIVVIFVLNDVNNFIPILLVTLLTFIDTFVLNPLLESKRKQLERKEESLRVGHTGSKFIQEFKSLNKKSYEFGNLYMVKKMVLAIFIITMVVVFMYFKQVTDLSFIVFYCFGYWYFHSNLTSLLTFSSKQDFLRQQRCLLMNIIKK